MAISALVDEINGLKSQIDIVHDSNYVHVAFFICKATKQRVGPVGTNSTRPAYAGSAYCEHAEMAAIRKLGTSIYKKMNMVCVRFSKTNQLGNARPCIKCIKRLHRSSIRVSRIYYSSTACGGSIVCEKFNGFASQHTSKWFRLRQQRN